MVNFLSALFGGSEATSKSTPVDMTPLEYKALRGPTMSFLIDNAVNPKSYGGPLTANLGASEGDLLSQLMSSGMGQPGRLDFLNQTIGGNFLPGQPGANPFLDAAISAASRPILEDLTQTLDRTLPGRFTQAGQFVQPQGSSAFDRAAAVATKGAANAIADIGTNMSFGAYEAERGRQQQAVQLSQQEVDTTIKNLQAQALPRMIQELGIDRGIALFQQQSQQLLQVLQLLAGVTSPTIGNVQEARSESSKGIIPGISSFFKPMQILPSG